VCDKCVCVCGFSFLNERKKSPKSAGWEKLKKLIQISDIFVIYI
jgi:hypothetical protein